LKTTGGLQVTIKLQDLKTRLWAAANALRELI